MIPKDMILEEIGQMWRQMMSFDELDLAKQQPFKSEIFSQVRAKNEGDTLQHSNVAKCHFKNHYFSADWRMWCHVAPTRIWHDWPHAHAHTWDRLWILVSNEEAHQGLSSDMLFVENREMEFSFQTSSFFSILSSWRQQTTDEITVQ